MSPSIPRLLVLALLSAPLAAQDGVVWPNVDLATDAVIVQTGATKWEIYCHGFMTLGAGKRLFPDDFASGIGVNPGTVRKVDANGFEDPSDGEEGDDATPTFPFVSNNATSSGFASDPRGTGLVWFGFHAKTTRVVQPYRRGSFRFVCENVATRSTLVAALTGAKVAVASATGSGAPINNARMQYVRIRNVLPAEILYYKFDRGGDTLAVNQAWPYAGAPQQGKMLATSGSPWGPGAFAGGLRGGSGDGSTSYGCDTDWRGDVYGSYTLAWWQRIQSKPHPQKPSIFVSGPGRLQLSASAANRGALSVSGWSPKAATLAFKTDLLSVGASKWEAVALVLDDAANTASLYVQGALVEVLPMTATPGFASASSPLVIGSNLLGNVAGIDEFRFVAHAAPLSAIKRWASGPSAAATAYGPQAHSMLEHRGQRPQLGNSGYELHVMFEPAAPTGLSLGIVNSPPWLISGVPWYSLPITFLSGLTDANGRFQLPLPIPAATSFKGLNLHTQAFSLTTAGLRISNAHLTSIR